MEEEMISIKLDKNQRKMIMEATKVASKKVMNIINSKSMAKLREKREEKKKAKNRRNNKIAQKSRKKNRR